MEKQQTPGDAYGKPTVERFGTFRELTLLGSAAGDDLAGVLGLVGSGCNPNTGDDVFACQFS